jgi:hypothetical protein
MGKVNQAPYMTFPLFPRCLELPLPGTQPIQAARNQQTQKHQDNELSTQFTELHQGRFPPRIVEKDERHNQNQKDYTHSENDRRQEIPDPQGKLPLLTVRTHAITRIRPNHQRNTDFRITADRYPSVTQPKIMGDENPGGCSPDHTSLTSHQDKPVTLLHARPRLAHSSARAVETGNVAGPGSAAMACFAPDLRPSQNQS